MFSHFFFFFPQEKKEKKKETGLVKKVVKLCFVYLVMPNFIGNKKLVLWTWASLGTKVLFFSPVPFDASQTSDASQKPLNWYLFFYLIYVI